MQESIDTWLGKVSSNNFVWYAKRLSANDAGATESHQAGIYIPKHILWAIFPSTQAGSNPCAWFPAEITPQMEKRNLRAVWYNEKTRNESRITQWNRPSRILEPDMTGGLVLFAFQLESGKNPIGACIWFCQNEEEESLIEEIIGVIEPGEGLLHDPLGLTTSLISKPQSKGCSLTESDIPFAWLSEFPNAQALIDYALSLMPTTKGKADTRLIARRECETALFYSVERTFVLPRIKHGFATVDEFVDYANSVTNRRKSRAGRSLELHLKSIFTEENLSFAHGEISEGNKKPDFLFPSIQAYQNLNWPDTKLRMLAAKTTCKDRWRQILNEADRIPAKHLVTLQQGVSENQFKEMRKAGVILVVPQALHKNYPASVQPEIMTLGAFIKEAKTACL